MTDLEMLSLLMKEEHRLREEEIPAFRDMGAKLELGLIDELSRRQREWVRDAFERLELDETENLWSSGNVAKGREVLTPDVLRTLPKRPPSRRS